MLQLQNVYAGYDRDLVLQGLSLTVRSGEIVGLLGRNGMGKTTTLRSILGLADLQSGSIRLDDNELTTLAPFKIPRLGIAYAPQEQKVFAELSVRENLQLGRAELNEAQLRASPLLMRFTERLDQRAGTLSGGEQQLLSLARLALSPPKYALLDEPMEGLMLAMISFVETLLLDLKRRGLGILLAEQNPQRAMRLCDRILVLARGRVIAEHSASLSLEDLQRHFTL